MNATPDPGTVIVTGAARGIGAAIARRYAETGWRVVAADIAPEVEQTAADISGDVVPVVADLGSADGANALADVVRATGLRGLVNNAGITRDAMLHKMTADQHAAAVRVNLGGPARLIEALAPLMDDGGSIVNISSKSASGNVGQYNYAVSKAGLLGLTRSLAIQHAPRLRINAISPAFISTEMTDAIPDAVRESILAKIPMGRPGAPTEIADVAMWLTSEASSYVTGQVVPVCGGRSFAP